MASEAEKRQQELEMQLAAQEVEAAKQALLEAEAQTARDLKQQQEAARRYLPYSES